MHRWTAQRLLIVCLFCALGPAVRAQQFRTYLYGELEGLPSTWVTDVDQGPDGRLWFASRSGLVVYDGTDWKPVAEADQTIPDGFALICSRGDQMIAAAAKLSDGLVIIDPEGSRFLPPPDGLGKKDAPVGIEASSSGFYLAAARSLWHWSKNYWQRIDLRGSGGDITAMTAWKGGVLVVHDGCLYSVDRGGVRLIPCARPVRGVAAHSDGTSLWLVGDDWIGRMANERLLDVHDRSHKIRVSGQQRIAAIDDGHGGLLAGNDLKVVHYDIASGRIRAFDDTAGHPAGGASNFFRDRDGNIWICSLRGLTRIPSFRFANYDRNHGLQGQEVSAITQLDSGILVLGHAEGITLMEDSTVLRRIPFLREGEESHGDIKALEFAVTTHGQVWIAAAHRGLGRLTSSFEIQWFKSPDGQPVNGIASDGGNGLWVVTAPSLYHFENDSFAGPIETLPDPSFRRVQVGKDGVITLLTMNCGIAVGRPGEWRHYQGEDADTNSCFASLWDPEGRRLLVGTRAGLFELRDDTLVRCTTPHIDDPVYSLLFDTQGKLWCGTHQGLAAWDGTSLNRYTVHQGLSGQETNRGALLCDQLGRIWVGTERGVSCYRAAYDTPGSLAPLVSITSLWSGDRQIPLAGPRTLDFGHGDLVFNVRALSLVDDGAATFRCRLHGYDREWWTPDARAHSALRFTNLPRGNYHLEVAAMNSRGVWSQSVFSPVITVKGSFYESLLFKTLLAVLVAALGFGISRYVHQRREAGQLQELVERRTEDLAAATRRYRDLFEKNRAAQLFVNAKSGRIVDANPAACALFELEVERLQGQRLSKLCATPETWVVDALGKALRGESLQRIMPLQIKGKRRDAEIHVCCYDADQFMIQATIHDVTERQRLELELHQARRLEAIGRLAGGVAHDFNNLLAAIIGHAEGPEGSDSEDRKAILGLAKRGASLVQQLLAFGRRQDIRPETLEVNQLIEQTLSVLGRVLPETVELRSQLTPDAGSIHCDWAQMELVLLNLAVNARDAMPQGGVLEIRTGRIDDAEHGARVRIDVRDSGQGMSPSTLESIFEPFFTTKEPGQGTGLGLSTVYGIIQQSGGSVGVKSALGKGTTVSIILPAVEKETRKAPKHRRTAPPSDGATILVVEDDPAVRPMIARMLRRRGYVVVEACDGAEALEICRADEHPIRVVLSDITMPNLDGPELAEHLRRERPDLKILFMSGYRGGLKTGIDSAAFIPKPFTSEELARRIDQLLGPTRSAAT